MDETTMKMVTAQLKSASAMIAMADCQYKTGLRVKRQGLWIAGVSNVTVTVVAGGK